MTRLADYGRFGLWWLGLAYIAASLTGYANALPPQVQLAGLLAALASLLNLLLIARAHRQAKQQPDPSPFLKGRRPDPTAMRMRARDYFGLRGVERD
jgi:membrane protein implicated in regulation of membrane protease activity